MFDVLYAIWCKWFPRPLDILADDLMSLFESSGSSLEREYINFYYLLKDRSAPCMTGLSDYDKWQLLVQAAHGRSNRLIPAQSQLLATMEAALRADSPDAFQLDPFSFIGRPPILIAAEIMPLVARRLFLRHGDRVMQLVALRSRS
jgi:hypothetical protein